MICFRSDYSQGAHPKVMEALLATNEEHTDGYGIDVHCEHAEELIREAIGREDAGVYLMIGGTPCNITTIAACLKPYESVIALKTGHAYFHETGGVEATGHRVLAVEGINGKMTPEMIDTAMEEFEDEHTPKPGMVYVSQPTEVGSIYSKAEMQALYNKCKEYGMYFYVDGARLGCALTCKANDLSLKELAASCDAFYIGGTKNGALFGEALVFLNREMDDHFRWMIKRQGGLLAKGRLLGVQFEALLEGGEESLYYEIARHSNELGERLKEGLSELGVEFFGDSQTNQVFPILPEELVKKLEPDYFFTPWRRPRDGKQVIRLVTGWGTKPEEVEAFLNAVREGL